MNEKLEISKKIDLLQNEQYQVVIANIQQRLQTTVSDSVVENIPSSSLQSWVTESNLLISKLSIHKLKRDIIKCLEIGDSLHAVDKSGSKVRFGRLEEINGTIRIHSFVNVEPAKPYIALPLCKLLNNLTGSAELPGKVFFQIQGFEEEVIVKTDEALARSPRVLNFLYFTSGLKGPSYKNQIISSDGPFASISCPYMRNGTKSLGALACGINDGGGYEATMKKGFVCGSAASSENLTTVDFCLMSFEGKKMYEKFGEIESGIQVFDLFSVTGYLVKHCGFVIEQDEVTDLFVTPIKK